MSNERRARCLLLDLRDAHEAADLAEALVVSEPWQAIAGPAAVVISSGHMAMLGYFGAADEARIEALRTQLDLRRRGFRFVGYEDAELLVTRLAARLVELLGAAQVESARLRAIPRGGHVVLGMLAYALPARAGQLDAEESDLWIVVDDCAISGARFLRWLDAHPGPEVVFAHLYSHPDLRRTLEQHPRVHACVAADDLVDHARDRLGTGYEEWRTAWEGRDSGVWAGQTDRVAFAWNEPDTAIWNAVTERVERGWHLVGPRRCLKNRRPIPSGAIQILTPAAGELRPSPGVVWAELGDELLLADTAAGEVLGLSGVGRAMWLAAVGSATQAEALRRLRAAYDVDEARLRADFGRFAEGLVERGLLLRS